MADGGFFYQALIYLTAAVVAVPIAKRLGLGSVLGYVFAGALIGPFGLALLSNVDAVRHVSGNLRSGRQGHRIPYRSLR